MAAIFTSTDFPVPLGPTGQNPTLLGVGISRIVGNAAGATLGIASSPCAWIGSPNKLTLSISWGATCCGIDVATDDTAIRVDTASSRDGAALKIVILVSLAARCDSLVAIVGTDTPLTFEGTDNVCTLSISCPVIPLSSCRSVGAATAGPVPRAASPACCTASAAI